ncbi:Uncharacterized conserved protein [Legionella hackeliae]|nr:hypothetical protein Lhac_0014 [Legionella hackeliae]STX48235.1 Uncharacterized conserved protein [Legionella hackeliae]
MLQTSRRLVIMCAEAIPWRCHRSLIADAESIRQVRVFHIVTATKLEKHHLTSFAVINKNTRPMKIYYPNDVAKITP